MLEVCAQLVHLLTDRASLLLVTISWKVNVARQHSFLLGRLFPQMECAHCVQNQPKENQIVGPQLTPILGETSAVKGAWRDT